jgi:hypothetical protein
VKEFVSNPLIMIAIEMNAGFTESTYPAVKPLIELAHADYFEYMPPGSFMACFKPEGQSRADALMSALRELRARHSQYEQMGIGKHKGVVAYEVDAKGEIGSLPMGDQVNFILRVADQDAKMRATEDR